MKFALLLLIATFPHLSPGNDGGSDTSDFVLVKSSNGISLYERWYRLSSDVLAREIKATFQVKTLADDAASLIRDESRGILWNKNTRVYQILPRDDDEWIGYIEYDLPWPISNQDCVLQYRQLLYDGSLRIEFEAAEHPAFPAMKKIQRIPSISGRWIFMERDGGLNVEYYVTTEPSAVLPAWITDPIIRNNLLETLDSFRELLEEPSRKAEEG